MVWVMGGGCEIPDDGCNCCIAPCISPITRKKLAKAVALLTLIIFSSIGLWELFSQADCESKESKRVERNLSKASTAFINEIHEILLLNSLKEVVLSSLLLAAASYGHVWVLVVWIALASLSSGWVSIVTAWALYLLFLGVDETKLWKISITGVLGLLSICSGIFSAVFLTIHIRASKELRRMPWKDDSYVCPKCIARQRNEENQEEEKRRKEEGRGDDQNPTYFLPHIQPIENFAGSTFRPNSTPPSAKFTKKHAGDEEDEGPSHSSNYLESKTPNSLY